MKRILITIILLGFVGGATAQQYPTRTVTVVVPFPAGSATDQVARVLAPQWQESLGRSFVIYNKAGALASIGTMEAAKSAPDGYTIALATNTTHATNVALFKKLPYDPVKDFAPIIRTTTVPTVLVVSPDSPAHTLKAFIDYAKAKSGTLTSGYWSSGSQVPIAKLKARAGFSTVDAAYKGSPATLSDIMGGHISFTFVDLTNALPQIQGGKLKGLGVTSLKRSPFAPDLPALAEVFPGFELIVWHGLVAPAGTPRDIVQRLYDTTSKILSKAETKAQLAKLKLSVEPLNPDEFSDYIKREIVQWSKDIKEAGIEPQ
ncbi:MAG: tripartite tricarboxylate transporter substrate binding protein [Betaproteobacteria bacterium]|nr:tripartite tricarboxylate transporter substrate binding protein [Betaproteobacteria bacterium]